MPNITTCTKCGSLYEAGSEEQANEQERLCYSCRQPRPAPQTVGENESEMRGLAVSLMKSNYRAADNAAKDGRLKQAEQHLEAAERWRLRARSHGARV